MGTEGWATVQSTAGRGGKGVPGGGNASCTGPGCELSARSLGTERQCSQLGRKGRGRRELIVKWDLWRETGLPKATALSGLGSWGNGHFV